MKLAAFETFPFKNHQIIKEYIEKLQKDVIYALVSETNGERCCCRQLWNVLEIHDVIDQEYVESLWEKTQRDDFEISNIVISKNWKQLLEDDEQLKNEEIIAKALLDWQVRGLNSTWKGFYGNQQFERKYNNGKRIFDR